MKIAPFAVWTLACVASMGADAALSWSGETPAPGGGYPRMAQLASGALVLGVDDSDAIRIYKSTNGGDTWTDPAGGAPAIPDPSGVNEKVGNVFPLGLPNGDLLVACRHLNDTDNYDPSPDGIKFFNIDIHRSSDGGKTWSYLSSPLNDPRSPGGGVAADQSEGAWEPFLYPYSPSEIWCLYSRQNAGRDSHPLFLNMKRSTDGGATWGAEETVVGVSQFGSSGSAGMGSVARAGNGDLIVVFETQSPNGNWFSIGMVRSTNNGASWSSVSTVYDRPGTGVYGAGAPYIVNEDGTLVVSYQQGDSNNQQMGYVTSADNGNTWSGNTDLFGLGSLWNSLFVDADGTLYGLTSGVKFKKHYPAGEPTYTNQPFRLFAGHSGKVLDVNFADPNPPNGTLVHQWSQHGGDNQKWILHDGGNGYFSLEPVSGPGKRLTADPDAAQGAALYIWDANGGDSQLWYAIEELGYYKLVSKVSGRVADLLGSGTDDGTPAVLWESLGGGNQLFAALMADGSQLNPFRNFTKEPQYKIINKNSGLVLDVAGPSAADGANIHQWSYYAGTGQKWAIHKMAGGAFWLEPEVAPGKCFQLDGWSTANGANITQWTYDGNDNKKWLVQAVPGDSYFKLRNKHSGKVAEAESGSLNNGANIQQWESNISNDDNQKWSFVPVSPFAVPTEPLLGNLFPGRISLDPGSVGNDQAISETATPSPFVSYTAAAGNGTPSYLWEYNLDGTAWFAAPAPNTAATYTAPNMQGLYAGDTPTYWRRRAVDGVYTNHSNIATILVLMDADTDGMADSWELQFFPSLASGIPGADPDGDGMDNFAEYGLGGNPTNSADTGHPISFEPDGAGGFLYIYPRRTSPSGLEYQLQTTGDLVSGTWTNGGYVELPNPGTLNAGFEAVTNQVPDDASPEKFIRLLIGSR